MRKAYGIKDRNATCTGRGFSVQILFWSKYYVTSIVNGLSLTFYKERPTIVSFFNVFTDRI